MPGRIANDEDEEIARTPHAPSGFRRRAGIGGVAAPGPCAAAWPASRRLAAAGTALGTRPMLLLGHAPSTGHVQQRPETGGIERVAMHRFLVVIEQADANFSAYSPDLPGCVATGATRE